MGKSTINGHFQSYVKLPEGKFQEIWHVRHVEFPKVWYFGWHGASLDIASIISIQLDPVGVCQVPAQYLDQDYCITSENPGTGQTVQILGHCMVLY